MKREALNAHRAQRQRYQLFEQQRQLLTRTLHQRFAFGRCGGRSIARCTLRVVVLHVSTEFGAFSIPQHRVMCRTVLRCRDKVLGLRHVHMRG